MVEHVFNALTLPIFKKISPSFGGQQDHDIDILSCSRPAQEGSRDSSFPARIKLMSILILV
jgi:hypothetical protein